MSKRMTKMSNVQLRARLVFWQSALEKLQTAYIAIVEGGVKSFLVDDHQLTHFDIPDLIKSIEDAEKKVDELTALLAGKGARRAFGIVPRDW